jgi:hypothetical protein
MRALAIIKAKIAAERNTCVVDAIISPQIDLFLLGRAPQTLHKNVAAPRSVSIYANLDGIPQQQAGEIHAGELAALVGVENLRPAMQVNAPKLVAIRLELGRLDGG